MSLVPSSTWTVVDWLFRQSLYVRSSRKTVGWTCLTTPHSIAAAFTSEHIPWSRHSVRFISLVCRLTSGLSPRSRVALRSSIMSRVGTEIQVFFGAWGLPIILEADSCTLEGFPSIVYVLIAWVNVLKESISVVNFYGIFRIDVLVIRGVCVKALGRSCLSGGIGTKTQGEGE